MENRIIPKGNELLPIGNMPLLVKKNIFLQKKRALFVLIILFFANNREIIIHIVCLFGIKGTKQAKNKLEKTKNRKELYSKVEI